MNEPQKDEDFELALRQWGAKDAPSDFAEKVASRFARERPGVLRLPKGRVLVPLLLAALFLSAGAFAAWQQWRPRLVSGAGETLAESKLSREAPVFVHQLQQDARAEPERQKQPSAAPPPRRDSKSRAPAKAVDSGTTERAEAPGPTPPKRLHLPDCECGTSAIVCSCSE